MDTDNIVTNLWNTKLVDLTVKNALVAYIAIPVITTGVAVGYVAVKAGAGAIIDKFRKEAVVVNIVKPETTTE